MLESVYFCNILLSYLKKAVFCGCISSVVVLLLLFHSFCPYHVTTTVLVTVTETRTITMTNEHLIQNSFPYLSFYVDAFSYACSESQTRSPSCRLLCDSHFYFCRLFRTLRYSFPNLSQMRFE